MIASDVMVDYQTPDKHTTVNFITSGGIAWSGGIPYHLQSYNDSQINISGGSVQAQLETYDNSQAIITDGYIKYYYGYGSSQRFMNGGIVEHLGSYENSKLTITGGMISGGF